MIKANLGSLSIEADLSTFLSVSINNRQRGIFIIQTKLLDRKPTLLYAALSSPMKLLQASLLPTEFKPVIRAGLSAEECRLLNAQNKRQGFQRQLKLPEHQLLLLTHTMMALCGESSPLLSVPLSANPATNNDSSQDRRAELLVTTSPITTCTSWINPNCSISVEFVCVLSGNTQRLEGGKKERSQNSITEVMKQHKQIPKPTSEMPRSLQNGKVVNKLNIVNVLFYTKIDGLSLDFFLQNTSTL